MKKIAVITARSGSKRLKNKNIKLICGKPLMAYSIEAALESGLFDRVILSTDSEEYAAIGREYGAEAVMRSEAAASDTATTFDAMADLFSKIELDFDYFVLLQPTSPLRTAEHIKDACEKFEEQFSKFDTMVSVSPVQLPTRVIKPLDENGSLKHFRTKRPGEVDEKEYMPNGAIFIAKTKQYMIDHDFYCGERTMAYIMDRQISVDVDNQIDFDICCVLMQRKLNGEL